MGLILDIVKAVDIITSATQEKGAYLTGKDNRTFRNILNEELKKIKEGDEENGVEIRTKSDGCS
ncbi:hypothetical protein [Clostridium sp.]|uniref:hypothetical protein n=1 Tax=Clostridium sp. TaxID=1506 RepID=UPI0026346B2D|nr:hypothetical protein [Clostridium sp.]